MSADHPQPAGAVQGAARRGVLVACLWLAASCGTALAATEPQSPDDTATQAIGPVEIRDDWLLAQGRLQLAAATPDVLPPGRTGLAFDVGLGNDFGWSQSSRGELPADRRFLVDGEHGHLMLGLRHSLGHRVDAALRIGLVWRNGGFLDGVIDAVHRWLKPIGVVDNGRPFFRNDLLRVEGRTPGGRPVIWGGRSGAGLSNTELTLRYGLSRGAGWRTALVARLLVPTGSASFGAGGWDVGGQLAAARALSPTFDLFLDVGVTRFGTRHNRGIDYAWGQVHAHTALEWRLSRRWALHLQFRGASRRVENLARYPGLQSYVDVSASRSLGRWRLLGGFSENLANQQSTVDFGVHLRLLAVY